MKFKSFKILAIAAACAAPALASAQFQLGSGVEMRIYGVADIMMQHYRADGDGGTHTRSVVDAGGLGSSRLGFLFTKELANGMKAGVRLESGFNTDSGRLGSTGGSADRVYSRQAYVSLAGSFGEVRMGRVQGPSYLYSLDFDPAQLGPYGTQGALLIQGSGTPGTPSRALDPNVPAGSVGFMINPISRTDNTIHYLSPKFGGFSLQASHSPSESVAGASSMTNAYLRYETGDWAFGYAIHHLGNNRRGGAVKTTDVLEHSIGVFTKVIKGTDLGLTFSYKDKTNQAVDANGDVAISKAEKALILSGVTRLTEVDHLLYTIGQYFSPLDDADARSAALYYRHYIDPTFAVFAGISYLTQDDNSQIRPSPSAPRVRAGGDVTTFSVGVNFRF
ncbi:porin [Caldimonas thermodepolymerans]|uniref:Porin-like protein n=1 Tax=Caldimonas thermodepolymerans TaxID=215580 RepID=A0AA46HUD7_9BURK|nr:porin [Caldimonas thermodepolymerans]QPC31517.1 porin [Caldimonas thermodepolymerans]RDH95135.1 porin-like protein [Caldimonas thermodepolymerans]TCP03240.1 porin-like protein [Caldimonas thermodepolymerans]UZG44269.1 porin [Caldimonas thermodepolymerans]UZG47935.1 porin [Caldimonas thermodepolymerans]